MCREAEVIECSVRGADEEKGDVLLAVALCSPATTRGEGELGCCRSTLTLSVSVSGEIQDRRKEGKKQQFLLFLIVSGRKTALSCVSAGQHGHQPSVAPILLPPDLLC